MSQKNAAELIKRIHMVEGQLAAITRMIDADEDCTAVLTQFKAARAGMERAFALFLEENLRRCVGLEKMPPKARAELERITAELVR